MREEVSPTKALKVYALSLTVGLGCAGAEESQPLTNACVTVASHLHSFIMKFETKFCNTDNH